MENKNPVVVVVGVGNGGIGEALVSRWSSEGFKVAALGRTAEKLDAMSDRVEGAVSDVDRNVHTYICDYTDGIQIARCVQAITAELGPIHTLIYNAASVCFKPLLETTDEEFAVSLATGPQVSRFPHCHSLSTFPTPVIIFSFVSGPISVHKSVYTWNACTSEHQ